MSSFQRLGPKSFLIKFCLPWPPDAADLHGLACQRGKKEFGPPTAPNVSHRIAKLTVLHPSLTRKLRPSSLFRYGISEGLRARRYSILKVVRNCVALSKRRWDLENEEISFLFDWRFGLWILKWSNIGIESNVRIGNEIWDLRFNNWEAIAVRQDVGLPLSV
jgi:hypothetical protein